jgi:DNA-binding CsgD family transcriptional regulator
MSFEEITEVLAQLSLRERQVLEFYCDGYNYETIARRLMIGKPTVQTYMGRIYIKLKIDQLSPKERRRYMEEQVCPRLRSRVRPSRPLAQEVSEPEKETLEDDGRALTGRRWRALWLALGMGFFGALIVAVISIVAWGWQSSRIVACKPIDLPDPIKQDVPDGQEFLYDVRRDGVGVDLSGCTLKFVFRGGDGKRVQFFFKNCRVDPWLNVYSTDKMIASGQVMSFNPAEDNRAVIEFDDFSYICGVGAKIKGGIEDVQIDNASLVAP